MSDQKQHYIPQFYQKRWAGADGRLCEYSRPYDVVKARMVYPAATGYQAGLYTIRDVAPQIANHTENVFLADADNGAADALVKLSTPDYIWTSKPRSAWTRFIMSLMHRTPERVEYMKKQIDSEYPKLLNQFCENYATLRRPGDPDTYEEYMAQLGPNPQGRASAVLLQKVVDSKLVGAHINQMTWHVLTLRNAPIAFLTSDRPILMTNGLAGPRDHIALPLGPDSLFLAVNDNQVLRDIQAMGPRELLHTSNDRVCLQARKYVYSTDASQFEFVEARLGHKLPSTPLETRVG
jgi:hypothetical protein